VCVRDSSNADSGRIAFRMFRIDMVSKSDRKLALNVKTGSATHLSTMYPHVILQIDCFRKRGTALLAVIILLARVKLLVRP